MNELGNIFNRVTGGNSTKEGLDTWYSALMERFGWIPYDEFLNLPGDVLFDLLEHTRKMNIRDSKHGKVPRKIHS